MRRPVTTCLLFFQLSMVFGFLVAQFYLFSFQQCNRQPVDLNRCSSKHGCTKTRRAPRLAKEPQRWHVIANRQAERYLSYQPPDAGWNNHRIAIENALVMAKLLNRTLVLHPMASHDQGLKLRRENLRRWKDLERKWGINWVYNIMKEKDLVPISEVLDLEHLSELLDVYEVKTSHIQFFSDFSSLTWHRVCHSNALGFWVQLVPSKEDYRSWRLLDNLQFNASSTSRSVRACSAAMRSNPKPQLPVVRGILNELKDIRAEMVYLEQDTSYHANIQFLEREDAIEAQKWILNHIRYGPKIYAQVARIVSALPWPFNAVHVRRTDHKISADRTPSFWVRAMAEKDFLNVSNALYIATDEADKTWFRPFQEAGYQLYFSDEFLERDQRSYDMDIRGLYDQLLCIRASLFVGSKGSSFSGFIYRSRGDVLSYDDVIVQHLPVGWVGHKTNRQTQRVLAWERLRETARAWKRAAHRYRELSNMSTP